MKKPFILTAVVLCLLTIGTPASSATQSDPGASADLDSLYVDGRTFEQFLDASVRRRDAWQAHYDDGIAAPELVERARALRPSLRLLVIAEDWCSDSVNTIPYLARLVEQVAGLEMRIIDSRAGRSLMASHQTTDGRPATPTVLLLDPDGNEIGAWVERPAPLQEWFIANEPKLGGRELGRQKQAWYDDDAGAETLREIVAILERADDPRQPGFDLIERHSGTDQLLQAISPVDEQTIWISGHGGIWGRSEDGGHTWRTEVMAGEPELQFRDVHAVDADTAYLLSAGAGSASRIYKTIDGGVGWQLQFLNEEPAAFYDCFDFWDADRGVAFSDSVDGHFVILLTDDSGATWTRVDRDAMPPALPGEGSFAASGTCVVTGDDGSAWTADGASLFVVGPNGIAYWTENRRSWQQVSTTAHWATAFVSATKGWAVGPAGRITAIERQSSAVERGDSGS